MYCVYLTIYKGNRLPPFYIGSSSLKKIQGGYRGSVSSREFKVRFKEEIQNNFHLFDIKIISKHTSRRKALLREEMIHRKLNVVDNPLYMNKIVAAQRGCAGISFKGKTNPFYGRQHSEETKQRLRELKVGTKNPFTEKHKQNLAASVRQSYTKELRELRSMVFSKSLKGRKLSEERKKQISDAAKKSWANSDDQRRKKMSERSKRMWTERKARETQK